MNSNPAIAVSPEVLVPERSVDFWIYRVNGHLTSGIQHLIEAGRALINAKSELGHGNFSSLFGPGKLRIDIRTAQLLMRVANNPALSNTNNSSFLPPALASLNVLASLDQAKLQAAIDAGKIAPHMTTLDARVLVKQAKPKVEKTSTGSMPNSGSSAPSDFEYFDTNHSLTRIKHCLDVEFQNCPDEKIDPLLRGVVSYLESFSATYENL